MMIIRKTKDEIELMDEANRIVRNILHKLADNIEPSVTSTEDLDTIAMDEINRSDAKSAFKGYRGFPGCLCVSLNDEIVHGIGSRKRIIRDGDLVSLDLGVIWKGYYGDSAITVPVGKVTEKAGKLVEVTRQALDKAVEKAEDGNFLSDISASVQKCAEENGFNVIRDFVGHGIGSSLHEDPQVPNFGVPGRGPKLKEGMVLAIEPMLSAGDWKVKIAPDGWTASTLDGSLSAHFEFSVAITGNGPMILGDSLNG